MRVQLERRAAESSSGSDRALFEASADERELARARAASDGRGGPAAAAQLPSERLEERSRSTSAPAPARASDDGAAAVDPFLESFFDDGDYEQNASRQAQEQTSNEILEMLARLRRERAGAAGAAEPRHGERARATQRRLLAALRASPEARHHFTAARRGLLRQQRLERLDERDHAVRRRTTNTSTSMSTTTTTLSTPTTTRRRWRSRSRCAW